LNYEVIMFEGTHGDVSILPKWVRFVAKKVYDHTHHVYETSVVTPSSEQADENKDIEREEEKI
jgi:hypothetical protein